MQLLRRLRFTVLLMSIMTLVACGGGGDGDLTGGGNGGGTNPDTVTLSIAKSEGDLSGNNDITVGVKVMKGTGIVTNQLVTFVLTDDTLATFLPEVGTAVTDSEGIATMLLKATNLAGGVEVTATVAEVDPIVIGFTSIGGGPAGEPGGEPGGSPVADSIRLFASTQQLASSGAQSVTVTAIAKDGDNNLLAGVKVRFSADSGGLEELFDNAGESLDITGPDGKATRHLSTTAEPTNRIITIKATSGLVSDDLNIQVVGTTITLTGSSSLALNDPSSYIIKLIDSDGIGLANKIITLSLSNQSTAGNVASITLPGTVTTDFNGQATVSVIGTTGGTNSIIATAHGTSVQQGVTVQADSFLFTNFGDGINNVNPSTTAIPDVLLSKTATVTLTWLRSGVAVTDGTVVGFTTTRGSLASALGTTVAGKVTTTLTSNNAGKTLITFTGTDTVDGKVIELNNQLEFEFVADVADRLIAQVYPKSISPNGQTSTVSVVVRDAAGNLVKNKTVDFKLLVDTSGGVIFPASAVTDINGSASTVYTSANTSGNGDGNGDSDGVGVKIEATVRDMPSVTDTVNLTVADREVFIQLGTGNSIENTDETTYNKKYSVFVTDIDSTPVPNVTLTISAIPSHYIKGDWGVRLKDGQFQQYITVPSETCINEDIDKDGILSGSEDLSGDGRLTPGNIVNVSGEVTTDEQGRAIIDIEYAEVFGWWAYIDLIASTSVEGTESFDKVSFLLPVSSDDVTNEDNPPATFNGGSPFGMSASCFDSN